jgi:hypothetical protein
MGTYVFTASAGDVVLVGMSDDEYHFASEVRLYSPDGSLIESETSSEHVEISRALPTAGDYTILVGDRAGTQKANYTLHLQRIK